MKTVLLFVIIASFCKQQTALDLPSNFKTCKKWDPKLSECITDAITDAVISLAQGLKSFKILPLEPLVIDNIKIGESRGPVSLKQEYQNFKMYGLTKNFSLYNYQINWDNLTFISESFSPKIDIITDCKLEGKILLLSIRVEGKCNITMYDTITKHNIYFENFQKDGETYMRAMKYIVQLLPKHVSINLYNLFNGDSILGEQVQRFISENSDLVFKELQSSYEKTFGSIFAKIVNNIFTRVPMNKIFKE